MNAVTKRTVFPGVDLTCITTNKFKTGFISISFLTPLHVKTVSKNALLPKVLCCGTSEHPTRQSLSIALEELYGTRIEPIVRKKGEVLCVGLYSSFIDDDFVRHGENLLEKTINLMGEILLSPATRGGLLLDKYVENEKKNLIDEIKNAKNDKISYAVQRMLESMCKSEAYGISSLGTEDTVNSITNRSLTKHYREILSSAKIEVIYCGSADVNRVVSAFTDSFSTLPNRTYTTVPETKVVYAPKSESPNIAEDKMNVSQCKLTIGYRLGKSMKYPNQAALMVFNALFGGSVTSKLFLNVRERLSLCYYASSMIDKHKGIMVVYSGVEESNIDVAKDEISKQLDDICCGKFSDHELESAKKYINTAIRSKLDTAGGIEDFYLDSAISGSILTPEALAFNAALVTKDEIIDIANNVILDTIHYITPSGGAPDED